ncbi:MAG: CheR family methyltransferase [Candidatus Sulfotelmatobacter sp.]
MLAGTSAGKDPGASGRVEQPRVDKGGVNLSSAGTCSEQPPQLSVSPAVFQKFQKLIYSETGIWLGSSKTALLCGRLFRRLRELGITSLENYYERVAPPEQHEERARMIDAITTNETRFFREPRQFEFLVQRVFPRWRANAEQGSRSKRVRIWSAGCSSGEEPYTLAMLLERHLPSAEGWDVRLLATDISNRVLEKARKGIYPLAKSAELPADLLHDFMLRGMAERQGEMKVKIELQRMVDFRRLNLDQVSDLSEGPFDAVFCRNVLIYFDVASKRRVVGSLVRHLIANGFLFVGHAENLNSVSSQLRSLEPSIYTMLENKDNL